MYITSDMLSIVNALHKPQCQVFFETPLLPSDVNPLT
jgi:hypothetical protein